MQQTDDSITEAFDCILQVRQDRAISNYKAIVASAKVLYKTPQSQMERRWPQDWPELPKARIQHMRRLARTDKNELCRHLLEYGVYTQMLAWKASAAGYVAAFREWCDCIDGLALDMNSITDMHTIVFARTCRNGNTLEQYLSHVRRVYEWLQVIIQLTTIYIHLKSVHSIDVCDRYRWAN